MNEWVWASVVFKSSPPVSSVVLKSYPHVSSVVFKSFPPVSSVVFTAIVLFARGIPSDICPPWRIRQGGWTPQKAQRIISDRWHGADLWKLHSKRVGKMHKHTRNWWGRCRNTLETGGEDVETHSKRVGNLPLNAPNDRSSSRTGNPTKSRGLQPAEWIFPGFKLLPSVVLHLLHSFRV